MIRLLKQSGGNAQGVYDKHHTGERLQNSYSFLPHACPSFATLFGVLADLNSLHQALFDGAISLISLEKQMLLTA